MSSRYTVCGRKKLIRYSRKYSTSFKVTKKKNTLIKIEINKVIKNVGYYN